MISVPNLFHAAFDFPQVNYKHYNGRKYRFAYGVAIPPTSIVNATDVRAEATIIITSNSLLDHDIVVCLHLYIFTQILKVDVSNGSTKCWSETDYSPSEPVFVPHPDAQNEDDGGYHNIQ